MEKVIDGGELMTLQKNGDEVFRVQAIYQDLEKSKKVEILHSLLDWARKELDEISTQD